ncbi:MAG: NitT/TauT family transport system ATP-binding protein [Actinomycetota bacterium]|jgi:NitT/TauT family transport system ATP-binding protein|nr:NitT/TauT family transport system ATP-binding protein [Actinomycetota bacterium]
MKLVVRDLHKTFTTGRKDSIAALDGVDLEVSSGSIVTIVGSSGCGKSTLLNIAGGLETATSGTVEIDGEVVVGPGPDRGMVFQTYSLYPWKTVRENVAFGLECSGYPKAQRAERIDELLGVTGLLHYADLLPRELSGGMRQRVAIARALAPSPDILLLDEPFGALDAQTKKAMQDFLLTVWQRTGSTILLVTHDVEEAIYLSERIYVFASRPGRVAATIDVPFGHDRGPTVRREPRFLDLRDEIEDLLTTPAAQAVS